MYRTLSFWWRHLLFPLFLGAWMLSSSRPAAALGHLFSKESSQQVIVQGARVLVQHTRNEISLYIQLAIQSEADELLWVIPTSQLGSLKQVFLLNRDIMDALHFMGAPSIELNTVAGNRSGCGGSPPPPKESLPTAPPSIQTIFENTSQRILSADVDFNKAPIGNAPPGWQKEQLGTWLNLQGFSQEQIQRFQTALPDETDFVFARIQPATKGIRVYSTLKIELTSARNQTERLPLATLPHKTELPILLYVLGAGRYEVTNPDFTHKDLVEIAQEIRKQFTNTRQTSYELAVRDVTSNAQGKMAVTEYAQDLDKLCPLDLTEEEANYEFCQRISPVVNLTQTGFAYVTRMQLRLPEAQAGASLPDLSIAQIPADDPRAQDDISGRVLALRAASAPVNPTYTPHASPTVMQTATAPFSTAQPLLWWLLLIGLCWLAGRRTRSPQHHKIEPWPRRSKHTPLSFGILLLTGPALFLFMGGDCTRPSTNSGALAKKTKRGRRLPTTRDLPLHKLTLPKGFRIQLYASRVPNARSMVRSKKGTLFVSTRSAGKVYALVDDNQDNKMDRIYTLLQGLNMPNGVALKDGALYVAEVGRVLRLDKIEDRLHDPPKPVVVTKRYPKIGHHGWKFIRFGPDGYLYIPVGAPCNICERKNPIFSTITRIKPDGSGFEIFAHGVRNSVGFDWHPVTKELWFTDNGRDWMGDDRPPCELNHAPKKGLHFGYPYCHGGDIPDPKYGKKRACKEFRPPAQRMKAHTAPLGMRFYTGKMFPKPYHQQIFVAQHGSWNRKTPIGYRVMTAFLKDNKVTTFKPFVEGFLQGRKRWGRPVDVMNMPDGSLLISDDYAGAIYRVTYSPPKP